MQPNPQGKARVVLALSVILLAGAVWWLCTSSELPRGVASNEVAPPDPFTRELASVSGRLVDAEGRPRARARVELRRLHPDTLVASFEEGFAPPPQEFVEPVVDAGLTEADGRFLLENAEVGTLLLLGIELGSSRASLRLVDVPLERGRTSDLGDVVSTTPSTPLASETLVGADSPAWLREALERVGAPAPSSDPGSDPVGAAAGTLVVNVEDPDGQPVADAELRFVAASPSGALPLDLREQVSAQPGGRYVVRLPSGKWTVLARAPGLGVRGVTFDSRDLRDFPSAVAPITIRLPRARSIAVRVVDEATREPIERALVAMLPAEDFRSVVAATRTSARGQAAFTRLSEGVKYRLRVTHPGFAREVEIVPTDVEYGIAAPFEVALTRGGDLAGRVTIGGESPREPLLVALRYCEKTESLEDDVPRLAVTAPDGSFRIRHLRADDYRTIQPGSAVRSLSAGDWHLAVHPRGRFDETLAQRDFKIVEGEEKWLDVETMPDHTVVPGAVRGRVLVDGKAIEGLQVDLRGPRSLQRWTDREGRFEFKAVLPGRVTLSVEQVDALGAMTLHRDTFDLPWEKALEFDIAARMVPVAVIVRSSDGDGVRGARIDFTEIVDERTGKLGRGSRNTMSGPDGKSGPRSLGVGRWRVTAKHDDFGRVSRDFEVPADATDATAATVAFDLVLDPGVRVAGTVELDATIEPDMEALGLHLEVFARDRPAAGATRETRQVPVAPKSHAFRIESLPPGRYGARLGFNASDFLVCDDFDVGPKGATDLVLRMRNSSQGLAREAPIVNVDVVASAQDGHAIRGAKIRFFAIVEGRTWGFLADSGEASTGADGRARFGLYAGRWAVIARRGRNWAASTIDVAAGRTEPIALVLAPGVRIAGTVAVEPEALSGTIERPWRLDLHRIEARPSGGEELVAFPEASAIPVDPRTRRFEVASLPPGRYGARLFLPSGSKALAGAAFDVGPAGASELALVFRVP